MDNRETLQQHNTRLNENNIDLSSILETINDLPVHKEVTLQEKSVTPSTIDQEIIADEEYTGLSKVTVAGDENLIAENIKQGTTIFGVEGTMEGAWDSSQLRKCYQAFYGNTEMVEAPYINTSNVDDMYQMFQNCTNLKIVPNYNTSKVRNMYSMFMGCKSLENAPEFDMSNNETMTYMYSGCTNLKNVPSYNTNKVNSMYYTFENCTNLESVGEFNGDKLNSIYGAFSSCYNLLNFGGIVNLGKAYTKKTQNNQYYTLKLSDCNKLTHESLMNVINKLYDLNLTYDVANGGTLYTQQLVLGSTNLAKLTAEEISIATNKGWVVS